MASKHIEIKGNETRFSEVYRRFIGDLQRVRNQAEDLLEIMGEAKTTGAGAEDWQGLVDLLGLTTAQPAADAQTVYNLHNDMKQKLVSASVDAFVNRLG